MIARRDNWPDLLAAYIDEHRSEPFAWGSNDCCLFASDWILTCTGKDPAETLRGTYSTALSGVRLIESSGGMVGIIQQYGEPLGLREIKREHASRGDIALRDCGLGDTAGIVFDSHAAFVSESGLAFANLDDNVPTRFWKF
jgi:hypothetical protein